MIKLAEGNTPVMKQFLEIKQKYKNHYIIQMGDFMKHF